MNTNVDEFRLFHQLLTKDQPDYHPFYFVLRPGGKEPLGERGSWKEARATFEEACDWMKAGYNIGIAGTDHDALVIIDIDKEGVVDDVKPTLCVRTRKRTGRHFFYFTSDTRCKINVPTAEHIGELRSLWQYVVCCGSYVRTDLTKLEAQPPEDQLPSLGSYTIEKDIPVATITFDELPLVFRKTMADQGAQQQAKREPKKWDREGPQSKLWSLTIEDVIGDHPTGNFPSPFHGSEGGINTTVSNGLLQCWRHKVSLTPLQSLVVKAGILDCMAAGDGHKGGGVGPSVVDFKDKELVLRLWDYAKKNKIVPENDIHPFGDDQPKKKRKKDAKDEPKITARRVIGTVIYTECKDDGRYFFARYDQATKKVGYVDVIPETGEHPFVNPGVTFPRRLTPYGTPADLYRDVKAAVNFAEAQEGKKNEIFTMFIMLHGCINPYEARHNMQIHAFGHAGSGKGRYVEIAMHIGDRARVTTDLTTATGQRMCEVLGGGLEILDEVGCEDDSKIEKYIRAKYDPIGAQQRIMDPKAASDIMGFRVSGPTLVAKRTTFEDDANIDRGIALMCERATRPYPGEIIESLPRFRDLLDKLALYWLEHYNDGSLLPSEKELMIDPIVDIASPRLVIAHRYLTKLVAQISEEAATDLGGFIEAQTNLRRELKATTDDGTTLRVVHDLIVGRKDGYTHSIEHKDGSKRTVVDTLSVDPGGPGRYIIAITRNPENGGTDKDTQVIGISWNYIAKLANLASRKEPGKILFPYSVRQVQHRIAGRGGVRTMSFRLDKLDEAFRTFVPDYDSEWKKPFAQSAEQLEIEPFCSPPSQQPAHEEPAKERNGEPTLPAPQSVADVADVAVRGTTNVVSKEEEGPRQNTPTLALPGTATTATSATLGQAGSIKETCWPKKHSALSDEEQVKIQQEDAALRVEFVRINEKYEDGEVLDYLINELVQSKASGDRLPAFVLRQIGQVQFKDRPDVVVDIVDRAYAELDAVATRIHELKKLKARLDAGDQEEGKGGADGGQASVRRDAKERVVKRVVPR